MTKPLGCAPVLVVLALSGCSPMTPAAKAPPPSTPVPQMSATVIDGVPLNPITAREWQRMPEGCRHDTCTRPVPDVVARPDARVAVCIRIVQIRTCQLADARSSVHPGTYFLVDQYSFEVPDGYIGYLSGVGHFVVMGAMRFNARLDTNLPATPIPGYCSSSSMNAPIVIHGIPASMYECGQDPGPSLPIADQYIETVSGHELVEWRQDGVTCEVSFHGHSTVNQDLAVAVAQSTHMVFPLSG